MKGTIKQTSISGDISGNASLLGHLAPGTVLRGSIQACGISCGLSAGVRLSGTIPSGQQIEGIVEAGGYITREKWPEYEGGFVVTPSTHEEIVLDTDGKVLAEDVTVLPIPTYEVSNTYGTTFIIG